MFKEQKGKNAFLMKKNQQKQKIQQQQKIKIYISKLQKNIRAFLCKKYLIQHTQINQNIKIKLLINNNLQNINENIINNFINHIQQINQSTKNYYLSKFIINHLQYDKYLHICLNILSNTSNISIREIIFTNIKFIQILKQFLLKGKGIYLLNLSSQYLQKTQKLYKIQGQLLFNILLSQFSQEFLEIQAPISNILDNKTIQIILKNLANRKQSLNNINLPNFNKLILHFIKSIDKQTNISPYQQTICYCLQQLMRIGSIKHEQIIKILIKNNLHLISLIQDQDLLQQLQNKLRSNQLLQQFTNQFLYYIQNIITNQFIIKLFINNQYKNINKIILNIINQLRILFQDRRLIFIRSLISSDNILKKLSSTLDPMFFQAFKMKLITMDDQEFYHFNLFNQIQWQKIIQNCISIADLKIQKLIQKINYQQQNYKINLIPFKKRASDQLLLKTIVDLLNNLYKKILRTKKLNSQIFVNYNISNNLYNFLFGKGAKRIQMLLKQLPFIFSFQSRIKKLKEFIKIDKKNYDRTLFLQEDIDQDLIIAVRRGNQFQDAYDACMNRDLRKKYKIIFFNQQGLEQQGVDGGGIIKEFINRVLKASFSQQYGLFMETPLNQIIPNPYSKYNVQYQFVGKLVGKAVYQGINIEQKFAQPFLNLLIGRQNTFEDLQYIDPDIYKGLLNIKHTTQDISELEQTFVIYDKLPNGKASYINLLCPSKPPSGKQVLVTNENKMQFLMNYADFKCNKQIQEKTRLFRKGFLKVMKPEWLTMFSNQQLNSIISGDNPDFDVEQLKQNTVYNQYHEKDVNILIFWQILKEMNCEQKSLFLLYVTSCSRPPTLGFASMKPKLCINKDNDITHLPTANTCMNVLRLPNYRNKQLMKQKLLYAIKSKAGFQFA